MRGRLIGATVAFVCISCMTVGAVFAESRHEITVSAAISLKDVFEELGKLYDARGGSVFFNFSASGNLAGQIERGAPVDVFASAAQRDMDTLAGRGLLLLNSRSDFAANSIVLIVPSRSKKAPASFKELDAEGVAKIAVGNPKSVPAGRYAEEVLRFFRLLPAIRDKLIFTENVRQVLDYVARGEVDAGIVYATDASTRSKEVRVVASAPEESHMSVVYPIAVVKGARDENAAKAFVRLVLSPEGRSILARHGFRRPSGAKGR
jgi:molybdate transport system substrate-binding protein